MSRTDGSCFSVGPVESFWLQDLVCEGLLCRVMMMLVGDEQRKINDLVEDQKPAAGCALPASEDIPSTLLLWWPSDI